MKRSFPTIEWVISGLEEKAEPKRSRLRTLSRRLLTLVVQQTTAVKHLGTKHQAHPETAILKGFENLPIRLTRSASFLPILGSQRIRRLVRSTTMSTFWLSNHSRTMLAVRKLRGGLPDRAGNGDARAAPAAMALDGQ